MSEKKKTCAVQDHADLEEGAMVMYVTLNAFRKEVCLEHPDCIRDNARIAAISLGMLTQAVAEMCAFAGVSADGFADDLLYGSKSLEVSVRRITKAEDARVSDTEPEDLH